MRKGIKRSLIGLGIAFTAAAGVALTEKFEGQRTEHFPLKTASEKAEQELWTISFASAEIDLLLSPDPHHNFLIIRNPDGKVVYSIHGFAVDPQTGEDLNWGDNSNILRARIYAGLGKARTQDIIVETDLFCGSFKDMCQHLIIAADAITHINRLDATYDKTGIVGGPAQNSNSVAYTLVEILDLPYPENNMACWAPGDRRRLLPTDWESEYDGIHPALLIVKILKPIRLSTAETSSTPCPDYTDETLLYVDPNNLPVAYAPAPLFGEQNPLLFAMTPAH